MNARTRNIGHSRTESLEVKGSNFSIPFHRRLEGSGAKIATSFFKGFPADFFPKSNPVSLAASRRDSSRESSFDKKPLEKPVSLLQKSQFKTFLRGLFMKTNETNRMSSTNDSRLPSIYSKEIKKVPSSSEKRSSGPRFKSLLQAFQTDFRLRTIRGHSKPDETLDIKKTIERGNEAKDASMQVKGAFFLTRQSNRLRSRPEAQKAPVSNQHQSKDMGHTLAPLIKGLENAFLKPNAVQVREGKNSSFVEKEGDESRRINFSRMEIDPHMTFGLSSSSKPDKYYRDRLQDKKILASINLSKELSDFKEIMTTKRTNRLASPFKSPSKPVVPNMVRLSHFK